MIRTKGDHFRWAFSERPTKKWFLSLELAFGTNSYYDANVVGLLRESYATSKIHKIHTFIDL